MKLELVKKVLALAALEHIAALLRIAAGRPTLAAVVAEPIVAVAESHRQVQTVAAVVGAAVVIASAVETTTTIGEGRTKGPPQMTARPFSPIAQAGLLSSG